VLAQYAAAQARACHARDATNGGQCYFCGGAPEAGRQLRAQRQRGLTRIGDDRAKGILATMAAARTWRTHANVGAGRAREVPATLKTLAPPPDDVTGGRICSKLADETAATLPVINRCPALQSLSAAEHRRAGVLVLYRGDEIGRTSG
jgi:hypothetical protein